MWTFHFAKKLPGAPVFFYVERNGKRLRTTTLVEHIPGADRNKIRRLMPEGGVAPDRR